MLKKLWYNPITRKVIGIFFFVYALYFIVRIVLMYIESAHATGDNAYQFGWIESYLLTPAIAGVMGYLFYHSGIRLQKSKNQTEKNA